MNKLVATSGFASIKNIFIILGVFITVMVVSISRAQLDVDEAVDPSQTAEQSEQTEEQLEQKKQAEKEAAEAAKKAAVAKRKKADKVFIPTEEISEDKPVPFPVDI